jgi:putative ATP-dependent endonuclease of OLD family
MRLTRLQVSNHKRVDDLEIEVRDHLVLVGANDVGKSSVLRVLDLILGASTAQIYGNISAEDFRDPSQPFVVEVDLSDFTIVDKALFPDEIAVDAVTGESKLTIRLIATVDDSETLLIERTAPAAGNSRQLSRDQQIGLGWKFLSATNQTRELREDRKSALDDILRDVDLGDEKAAFAALAETLTNALGDSEVLKSLRGSLANQLSKALPEMVAVDDLSFVPGSAADNDVLSDVRLQVKKDGVAHDLSAQSDGTRALYAIALYDLMSVGANVVGIDEPEVHLHPTSQRSLARLLRANPNQKIIATHSSDIVGAFDPDSIVVVHRGGKVVQPQAGFLSSDERMAVRWWVRDRLEPLTARRVIAVEGLSDRILLERAADLTARNLDRLGVSVLELGGFGDMGVIEKLFGSSGFNVPISRLIDEDAERGVANQLGLAIADLPNNSVWVSRGDLEEEYIRALGAAEVWGACQNNGQFSTAELRNGPTKSVTDPTVAAFCKKSSKYKIKAALSILGLLDGTNARQITSVENLLGEIAS